MYMKLATWCLQFKAKYHEMLGIANIFFSIETIDVNVCMEKWSIVALNKDRKLLFNSSHDEWADSVASFLFKSKTQSDS